MQTHSPFRLVEDQRKLAEICGLLQGSKLVALDTEFVRESTYFPKLCLIQLATDKLVACIDCLAAMDLAPLFDAVLDSDITWIVHSGRQDIEVVWHAAHAKPSRVFDTQIAAALLGEPPQIGLREILKSTLGVEIGKALTRTNWARRPLGDDALDYALDDVRYLPELWQRLARKLTEADRFDWCVEDCQRALDVPVEPELAGLFQRTKGSGRLDEESALAALALLEWREALARRADRPRRWVLTDETLVALAARRPTTRSELREIEGLSDKTIAKNGDSLLAAIAAAHERRFTEAALERVATRPDPALLKSMQKEVRACAQRLGIEPELLAAKRDLVALVLGSTPERLRSGWRARQLRLP